jgi:hypothetical protein
MLFMIKKSTLFLPFILIIIQSCVNHDTGKQCLSSATVSFAQQIKPIINSNCAIQGTGDACHNGDNGADLDWRVLANFQQHSAEVKRRVMLPVSDGDHMPREGSITPAQIQLIVCWVEQGAQDN